MKIQKLTIQNYRNFKNFEIELKPFTLIIGENNIGKTNLLNAIGLIFSQEITFFKKRMLEIDDINYEAIVEFKKEILGDKPIADIKPPEVIIEAILDDLTPEQKNVVADWFIGDSFENARLTYKFYPKTDLSKWIEETRNNLNGKRTIDSIDFPIDKYGFQIFGGEDDIKQVDYYFLKALKFEFLDAIRDAKTQLVASGDYRLLYKILTDREEKKYQDLKDALLHLTETVAGNEELKAVRTDIEKYLAKTSLVEDDLLNKVQFEFSKPDKSEMLKKISLQYGDSPINVERNGTGRNNLLYISLILSHLLYKNNVEVKFRIIGIEEPESHLHPHLQEHLSKNVQNEPFEDEQKDNLQVIVTSHCPHITSKLKLENTSILYKTSDGIKSCYFIDSFKDKDGNIDAESRKHIRYLERFLDATKSTMFFGRKLILVEGIAEQILIPKLFEIYTEKTLEKIGCTLVNVSGVGFRHFLEIIRRGFFIKSLVFTDSDSETKNKDRAEKLESDYDGLKELIKISITKTSTFEKEIIESNKTGKSKFSIIFPLMWTRPQKAKGFPNKFGPIDLDVDECFSLIEQINDDGKKESYKAEFAMNLRSFLEGPKAISFNIPNYLKEGFDFLMT